LFPCDCGRRRLSAATSRPLQGLLLSCHLTRCSMADNACSPNTVTMGCSCRCWLLLPFARPLLLILLLLQFGCPSKECLPQLHLMVASCSRPPNTLRWVFGAGAPRMPLHVLVLWSPPLPPHRCRQSLPTIHCTAAHVSSRALYRQKPPPDAELLCSCGSCCCQRAKASHPGRGCVSPQPVCLCTPVRCSCCCCWAQPQIHHVGCKGGSCSTPCDSVQPP
jgi:hypothetical protein